MMKKLFNIALCAWAALSLASCAQDHIDAQFIPGNAVAPALGEEVVGAGVLTKDIEAELISIPVVNFADYGIATGVGYTLYAAQSGNDMAEAVALAANIGQTEVSFTVKALNTLLMKWVGADAEATVDFQLVSNLTTDKGAAVADTELASNIVSASFTSYNAIVAPVDEFEHVWVIGDFNGWAFENVKQYLYNYTGDKTTYDGIIDFGEKAANGFKLTGKAGWDDSCNWGLDGAAEAPEAEATSLQLISSGGSSDIKVYSKRYYQFSFNKSSLKLSKVWGANSIGVVGSFNDWGGSADVEMTWNGDFARFYADVDFASDAEIKFRADSDWTTNWGGKDGVITGDNIAVPAGQYRIYLDLGRNTYELNAGMYGKDEPVIGGGEEPEDPVEPTIQSGLWGLIGTLNGASWDKDFYMTACPNGNWVSPVVNITTEQEFKIRWNSEWNIDRGGELGVEGGATQGGSNMKVTESGDYAVVYNPATETITLQNAAEGWGIIGDALANSWAKDTFKTAEIESGVYVTAPFFYTAGSFKFRKNSDWDTPEHNFGGDFVALGEPFAVTNGGNNITPGEAVANTWMCAILNTNDSTVTLVNPFVGGWGVVGVINDMNWNGDVFMYEKEGKYYSAPFVAKGEFKIRKDAAWNVDRAGTFAAFDEPFAVSQGNGNININLADGESKSLTLVYDPTAETITVSEFK